MAITKYKGKQLIAFGDSITAGAGAANNLSYIQIVARELGMTLINKGVSGCTINENLSDMLKVDFTNTAIVTIMTGTNGTGNIGTINDIADDYNNNASTFIGKLGKFVEYVRCQNPYLKVFLLTPPRCGGILGKSTTISDAYKEVSKRLAVKVIDVRNNCGVCYDSNSNKFRAYSTDGTHPSAIGHEMIAEYVLSEIY